MTHPETTSETTSETSLTRQRRWLHVTAIGVLVVVAPVAAAAVYGLGVHALTTIGVPRLAAHLSIATLCATGIGGWILHHLRRHGSWTRSPSDTGTVPLSWREPTLAVTLGFAATAPVWPSPTTRLFAGGDGMFFYWQGWQSAENLRSGHLPWNLTNVAWPAGNNLLAGDGILHSVVATLWNLAVGNPVLATNLVVVTAVTANALAANTLARRLQPHRAVAMLCMVAFVATPLLAIRYPYHPNLMFAAPTLMVFASLVHDQRYRPVRVGIWLGLATLSSMWWGLFTVIAVVIAVAARGLTRAERRPFCQGAAIASAIATAMYLPVLLTRLRLQHDEAVAGSAAAAARSAEAAGLYFTTIPNLYQPSEPTLFGQLVVVPTLDGNASIGIVSLVAFAALATLATPWRRILLSAGAVLAVLTLGTTLAVNADTLLYRSGPFELLLHLPGLGALRAPGRIGLTLACIGVAALAVVGGHWWPHWTRTIRVAVTVALLGACALWYPLQLELGDAIRPTNEVAALTTIAERGDGTTDAVLRVPHGCFELNRLVADQMIHGQPEVGCHGFISSLPMASKLTHYNTNTGWRLLRCSEHPYEVSNPAPLSDLSTLTHAEKVEAVRDLPHTLGVRFVIYDRTAGCHTPEHATAAMALLEDAGTQISSGGRLTVYDLQSS